MAKISSHARTFGALAIAAALVQLAAASSPQPNNSLVGVTLGQTEADVKSAFGSPAQDNTHDGHGYYAYPVDNRKALVIIHFKDANVTGVMIGAAPDRSSHLADSYGLNLGDSMDRISQVRGKPSVVTPEGTIRYITPDVVWSYIPDHQVIHFILMMDSRFAETGD